MVGSFSRYNCAHYTLLNQETLFRARWDIMDCEINYFCILPNILHIFYEFYVLSSLEYFHWTPANSFAVQILLADRHEKKNKIKIILHKQKRNAEHPQTWYDCGSVSHECCAPIPGSSQTVGQFAEFCPRARGFLALVYKSSYSYQHDPLLRSSLQRRVYSRQFGKETGMRIQICVMAILLALNQVRLSALRHDSGYFDA